jgi:two-component system KDP operon response regulator KdpE
MDATVLIVEDDKEFAYLLREGLQDRGFQVLLGDDGIDGMELLQKHHPDVVLLDILMPRMDGWETCRHIRATSNVPIIMITALRDEQERVRGLQLGADDYVIKPFSIAELSARIQALLRRCEHPPTMEKIVQIDGRLVVDRMRRQVFVDGRKIDLSATEFKLLDCFLERPNLVWTSQNLLTQVWGWEYAEEIGYLRAYIYYLRNKLEEDPQNPQYILTERGEGYRFQMPV